MIRLLLAAGIALVVSLFGTKFLIAWLTRHRIGQPIHEDVPEGHTTKAGTPTMGGIAIVSGGLIGYLGSNVYRGTESNLGYTRTGLYVMLAIAAAGVVGLTDDWIKVANERNLGLNSRAKMLGLLTVAIAVAWALASRTDVALTINFTRGTLPGWDLPKLAWVAWAVVLITGSANAVNLTDGLDGLAAGAASFGFSAYVVVGFWTFRYPEIYQVADALDVAVVAAAMLGACVGFLWWNAAPAQIFMGDTGSLAIGGGLAALSVFTRTELLMLIVAGLFLIITLSVVLQVGYFKVTKGKRLFKMAPLQHHFELLGWAEITIVIRFWIICGLCVALGLGIFYAEWTVGLP
ncbi:MAG: phospho-N-acetylmuramoyl-pentapeptide-transferase [Microthrixaceae bacterium]|nr:phospho-N-acetylmuramoyl-pentapeptide-transferase [Microthrixaceae bacterium]